jgi:hypothetical protein
MENLLIVGVVIVAVLVASFFIPTGTFSYIKMLLSIVGKIFKHKEEEYPALAHVNRVLETLHTVMVRAKELGLYGEDLETTFAKVKAYLIDEVGAENVALVPDEILLAIVETFHSRFASEK